MALTRTTTIPYHTIPYHIIGADLHTPTHTQTRTCASPASISRHGPARTDGMNSFDNAILAIASTTVRKSYVWRAGSGNEQTAHFATARDMTTPRTGCLAAHHQPAPSHHRRPCPQWDHFTTDTVEEAVERLPRRAPPAHSRGRTATTPPPAVANSIEPFKQDT